MYDKKYALTWIENDKSGKDFYRTKFLEPFLKDYVGNVNSVKSILDVGCGWGSIIPHIKNTQKYFGVDVVEYFIRHIKEKYPSFKGQLQIDGLPHLRSLNGLKSDLIISYTLWSCHREKASSSIKLNKMSQI